MTARSNRQAINNGQGESECLGSVVGMHVAIRKFVLVLFSYSIPLTQVGLCSHASNIAISLSAMQGREVNLP